MATEHRFRKEKVIIGTFDDCIDDCATCSAVNGSELNQAIDDQLLIACIKAEILTVAKFEKLSDTA
jgi:hypothetical protein